jgi:hypothetical protein
MPETLQHPTEPSRKRPGMLALFCIMSFISNGLIVILGFAGILSSEYFANLMEKYTPDGGSMGRESLLLLSFSVLIIFGLKLWGVILMFLGRKGGYILYLIPTGILMIVNIVLLFATYNFFVMGYLLISILFVVVYGVFLKFMK